MREGSVLILLRDISKCSLRSQRPRSVNTRDREASESNRERERGRVCQIESEGMGGNGEREREQYGLRVRESKREVSN